MRLLVKSQSDCGAEGTIFIMMLKMQRILKALFWALCLRAVRVTSASRITGDDISPKPLLKWQ